MTPEVFRIKAELEKNENFKTIKDIEQYAEFVNNAYWNKLDIICEIRKAALWIISNNKKRNYRRFLTNWFSRASNGR